MLLFESPAICYSNLLFGLIVFSSFCLNVVVDLSELFGLKLEIVYTGFLEFLSFFRPFCD